MTDIIIALVAIAAPFAAWLVATWRGKRIGRKEAAHDAEDQDRARADELRRLGQRVRRDEIRYRDGK